MLYEIKSDTNFFPHDDGTSKPAVNPEPLSCIKDFEEFRAGLNNFRTGKWHVDRWTTFRLRFGIYAQKQNSMHMVRMKVPGGRISFDWARAIALACRQHCRPEVHLTTRQGIQFYDVTLDRLADLQKAIFSAQMTTREASGNTFRNVTACPMAGFCPREHVDAGAVAQRLSATWLRHPLVQHMPRKVKTAVSGCEMDCGATSIDDLGFLARLKDGQHGFKVVAGGGLGNQPRAAIQLLDFVGEEEMPAVQEALARIHHRFSNRKKKMASRLKFLVDRLGEEEFRNLFLEEFERLGKLPHRPWRPLEWRTPDDDQGPHIPGGRIEQHDGTFALVVRPRLGMLSSDDLEKLTGLAEESGADEFRITREQNIIVVGVPSSSLDDVLGEIRGLGLKADERPDGAGDVVSCPGTSTCPIGITNSRALAEEILADADSFLELPETRVRISGCHNSCAQHHVGDFGFHGVAKKIGGRNAPHYQVHLGGELDRPGFTALQGPLVPARHVKKALAILLGDYAATRKEGQSVRQWAQGKGQEGIERLLTPVTAGGDGGGDGGGDPDLLIDVGGDRPFLPPVTAVGECAAGAVVGEFLDDMARVGRLDIDRHLAAGDIKSALGAGKNALIASAKRLLLVIGAEHDLDDDGLIL
ncbi:MAG: nitrite/sulfite reductase, partial [Rhodospirillales bacterium]